MATKRMKRRTRRRSCKNGKLKRPVRTKKGRKRRCKKSRRRTKRKSRRRRSKKSFRMNCKLLEQNEVCSEETDPVTLELIDYDNYKNYYMLIDANGTGRQCISVDTYRNLSVPKENPITRERITCPPPPPEYKMKSLVTYVNGQVGNDILMFNETTGRIRVLNIQLLTEYWFDSIKNKSIDDETLEDIILFELINPDLRNAENWTALNLAYQRQHTSYIQILRKYTTVV